MNTNILTFGMKTIKYLIFILFLASCKKEEIKPVKEVKTYNLSVKVSGAQTRTVTLNGINMNPPFQVKTGDVLTFLYQSAPTTPTSYDVRVYIYLDGTIIGSCSSCDDYKLTYKVE